MLSLRSREGAVKADIPRQLYLAIVRLQAAESLDWDEACVKAAGLIDANSEEFKRTAQLEAQRLYKQRFMREVNKARKTVEERALELVRTGEDNFRAQCSICGKPMYFSDRDSNWESEIKPTLYEAFKNWHHTRCAGR